LELDIVDAGPAAQQFSVTCTHVWIRTVNNLSGKFDRLAQWTAHHAGRPTTFAMALAVIVAWAISGPIFQWSDTWQLVINTGTTIVTFLMVFLIQNTQNRDTEALQLKLDELILANEKARNRLLELEDLTEEEMDHIKRSFIRLAKASPLLTDNDDAERRN
jgi:low affinity Fe/Cu permease